MKLFKYTFCLALSILSFHTFAQQSIFSGTWKLNEKTNLTGKDYGNAVPALIKVEQAAAEITVTRTEVSPDEDTPGTTSTEKVTLEAGKGTVGETADKRKIITTAKLTNNSLTETKTISQAGQESVNIRIKETSEISADGKTLTLVKEFENLLDTADKWSVKGIYTKQN